MIDQNTDPTFDLFKKIVEERPSLGERVKTAQVGSEVRNSLPDSSFANPSDRIFPIHTPEDALLSMAYATKQAGVSSETLNKIETAMDLYGVELPDPVEVKQASSNVRYLVPNQKLFPIKTAADISGAEIALHRNSKKLSPDSMAVASVTLIKQAASYGMNVSRKTLQAAGLMQCDRDKAAEWIEARAMASDTSSEAYLKLASVVRGCPEDSTREDLTKIAGALQELDYNAGLTRHYGKTLPSPQDTVFNSKVAMGSSLELAGVPIPVNKLLDISPDMYGDILGEDIVSEISSDGEVDLENLLAILPTLPSDLQELLVGKLGLDG
jgi:hypothetical protein